MYCCVAGFILNLIKTNFFLSDFSSYVIQGAHTAGFTPKTSKRAAGVLIGTHWGASNSGGGYFSSQDPLYGLQK